MDRKKDMIITGGENVYCAGVENILVSHFKHPMLLVFAYAPPRNAGLS
ncbi:hypothetical protein AAGW05_14705 [Arthrobacter sp. LAPM80]